MVSPAIIFAIWLKMISKPCLPENNTDKIQQNQKILRVIRVEREIYPVIKAWHIERTKVIKEYNPLKRIHNKFGANPGSIAGTIYSGIEVLRAT